MSNELKPCPFCGKEGKVKPEHFTSIEDCKLDSVMCEKCGIYFETYTRDDVDAVTIWNTRPAEDALRAEIERLKEALTQIGIAMLYSDDENADNIFKLCQEKVGDAMEKAYVEKLSEDVEKMALTPYTNAGSAEESR